MQVTLFQPQVDSWSYYVVLDYHMAVELQLPGASSSVPGALFMTGETSTDLESQTVALYNQKIVRVNFPGLDPATAQQYQAALQSLVPTGTMHLSLPQLQSYAAAASASAATVGHAPRRRWAQPAPRRVAAVARAAGAADLLQPVTGDPRHLFGRAGLCPGDAGLQALLLREYELGGIPGQEHRHLLPAGPGQLAPGAGCERSLAAGDTAAVEPEEPAEERRVE